MMRSRNLWRWRCSWSLKPKCSSKGEQAFEKWLGVGGHTSRQHTQTWGKKYHLPGKDAQFSLSPFLRVGPAGEADDADNVAALEVLVLLLEGSFARGVLQLAHDLDGNALLLGHVELEGVAALALGDDADANTHLVVLQRLALVEVLVLVDEFGELGVDVELVRVRVRLLGLLEGGDLLGADLEVLVRVELLDVILLLLLGACGQRSLLLGLLGILLALLLAALHWTRSAAATSVWRATCTQTWKSSRP